MFVHEVIVFQPSLSFCSPADGTSSLVSTALPTPLIDFESSSNCSESTFPQGDLYPASSMPPRGATDFTGNFAAPKLSSFPLRSPLAISHLGPSTSRQEFLSFFSHCSFSYVPPGSKNLPKFVANAAAAAQKRNGDISRKNFQEKVTRHRGDLKFMVPKVITLPFLPTQPSLVCRSKPLPVGNHAEEGSKTRRVAIAR